MNIEELFQDSNGEFRKSTPEDNAHLQTKEGKVTCMCGECDTSDVTDEQTISFQVFGVGAIRADQIGDRVYHEMQAAIQPNNNDGTWDVTINRLRAEFDDPNEKSWATFVVGSIFTKIMRAIKESQQTSPEQELMDMLRKSGLGGE